jgi:hypothetical protein
MKINRLKMQFDERKRKLIISEALCSAKKTFSFGRRGYTLLDKSRATKLLFLL